MRTTSDILGVSVNSDGSLSFDWPVLIKAAHDDLRLWFKQGSQPEPAKEGGLELPSFLYVRLALNRGLQARVEGLIGFRLVPMK